MNIEKIESKSFIKNIIAHQNKIFYCKRGQSILSAGKELGFEFNKEQVVYVHSILNMLVQDTGKYESKQVEIPVSLLFGLMTPYNASSFTNNKLAMEYMAKVSLNCIDPLNNLINVRGHSEGKCRAFYIAPTFLKEYCMLRTEKVELLTDLEHYEPRDKAYRLKKAFVGLGFEKPSRLNPATRIASEKFKVSKFVLDVEGIRSKEGRAYIVSNLRNKSTGKINPLSLDSLGVALYFMNTYTSEPQYHETLHLQTSGRVHTIGGCLQLSKWFRKRFILPVNPNNLRMEVDLKCAQLIILTDILDLPELKAQILQILEEEGSIWASIGDPNLDKRIKKIIVYAFCFGAEIKNIPFLATVESMNKGLGIKVTKKIVSDCLDGLLKPLLEAREIWLDQFKTGEILKYRNKTKVTNKLGFSFNLYTETVKDVITGARTAVMKDRKTGSNLLAFLCQSEEQFIMQNLIANHVDQNILTWAYDGMCLEVSPDEKLDLEKRLIEACPAPLDIEYF